MEGKRKVRRKNILPADILLGHKVKNLMTVIWDISLFKMGSYQILTMLCTQTGRVIGIFDRLASRSFFSNIQRQWSSF